MGYEVEYTDEFGDWWEDLSDGEQESIAAIVSVLEVKGPQFAFPFSSAIKTSKHSHMRQLRVEHVGEPYRVLYAFDPRRTALLPIGGNKAGDDRWYAKFVPVADRLYDEHLAQLEKEGDS